MKNLEPPEKTWEKPFTCSKCGGRATAEVGDLRHSPAGGDQRDWYDETFYFYCPFCNTKYSVPKDTIPYIIQQQLKVPKSRTEWTM